MLKDGRIPAPAKSMSVDAEDFDLEAATKAPKAKEDPLAAPSVTASVDTAESPHSRPGLRPDAAGPRDASMPPPSRVSSTSSWDTTQKQ